MSKKDKSTIPLPTRQQLLDFVKAAPGRVGKREIARAFNVPASERLWLKAELKALEAEGLIDRDRGKKLLPPGTLPEISLLDIAEITLDGELLAKPVEWAGDGRSPRVLLIDADRRLGEVGVGDRVLARVKKVGANDYEGRVVRIVAAAPEQMVGIYSQVGGEGRLVPTERKRREEYAVTPAQSGGAQPGEVVIAERLPGRGYGLRQARVVERLGRIGEPRSLSLIAAHQHGIPLNFPPDVEAEAAAAKPTGLGQREDLRHLPFVTIDPEDARDRDDAVYAEPDDAGKNPGGYHLIVAIADVAHYVTPGSALDREARQRGNSVYFPDRVIPMLPHQLSSDLCSLHERVDRPVLAAHLFVDAEGQVKRHKFTRAMIRSAAALSYGEAQAALEGRPSARAAPVLDTTLRPLQACHDLLAKARAGRAPLDIELPERQIVLGRDGFIKAVRPRPKFATMRLIEDMMIAANVAAAETLGPSKLPCMYRVHEEPPREKLDSLREFLDSMGLRLAKGQVVRPATFNRVLERAAATPQAAMINEVVLRAQCQAYYAGDNLGHFGLALTEYAHFTSPIRRYADLLVHRALISRGRLGDGGLSENDIDDFDRTAERISAAERRAMAAERDALDRFTAVFMANRIGEKFLGRISGVTRFGLFVKIDETGADGLVLAGDIGDDYYVHDEARHALVGRETGRTFRLGDRVEVQLTEADIVTGGIRLNLLRDLDETVSRAPSGAKRRRFGKPAAGRPKGPVRGKGGKRR